MPLTVVARNNAFTTASSVASTVASKSTLRACELSGTRRICISISASWRGMRTPLRKQEKSLHFHYGPLSLCEPAPNLPGERVAANSKDVQEKIHDCGGILPFAAQVRSMACVK